MIVPEVTTTGIDQFATTSEAVAVTAPTMIEGVTIRQTALFGNGETDTVVDTVRIGSPPNSGINGAATTHYPFLLGQLQHAFDIDSDG